MSGEELLLNWSCVIVDDLNLNSSSERMCYHNAVLGLSVILFGSAMRKLEKYVLSKVQTRRS